MDRLKSFLITIFISLNIIFILKLSTGSPGPDLSSTAIQIGPSGPFLRLPGPARNPSRHEQVFADNLPESYEVPGWPRGRSRNVEAYLSVGRDTARIKPEYKGG